MENLPNKDSFCWRCHRDGVNIDCETCPRTFHHKCLKQSITDDEHWPCPECVGILRADSSQTRIKSMKGMPISHLSSLLDFALKRMIQCQGSEPFMNPVNENDFPEYKKYIIQPMDLSVLKENIENNVYGSVQAFEADAKWILHNSIIFNSYQSKLTSAAKNMLRICKQEMMEIENCPSCYLKANVNPDTWFVEVCPIPHIPVWAKLKGFPYWPAKAMSVNSSGLIDVRFFGAHDRAWVHWRECYLYSERDPNTFKQKRYDIEKCVEELDVYVENLKKIYGEFRYAPFRTPVEPSHLTKQLQVFLPKYKSMSSKRPAKLKEPMEVKTEESQETPSENSTREDNSTKGEDMDTTNEDCDPGNEKPTQVNLESEESSTKKSMDSESIEDEEDMDDTQVPSNVSLESSTPKVYTRIRRKTTDTKSSSCKSCDNHSPTEETTTPKRLKKLNVYSAKIDSKQLSNKSDKIHRLDCSEATEISLEVPDNIHIVNGENVDIKKKPVQVDINNKEISISPIKLKIISRMKGPEKTEETISTTEEEVVVIAGNEPNNQTNKENDSDMPESSAKSDPKAKVIQPAITEFFVNRVSKFDVGKEKPVHETNNVHKKHSVGGTDVAPNGLDAMDVDSLEDVTREETMPVNVNIEQSKPTEKESNVAVSTNVETCEVKDEEVEISEKTKKFPPIEDKKETSPVKTVDTSNRPIVDVPNRSKGADVLPESNRQTEQPVKTVVKIKTVLKSTTATEVPEKPAVTSEQTTKIADNASQSLTNTEVMEETNAEDRLLDPKNILENLKEVIHSGLSSIKDVKINIQNKNDTNEQKVSSDEPNKDNISKKRKLVSDEISYNPAKLVKLVPIESIMSKTSHDQTPPEKNTNDIRPSSETSVNHLEMVVEEIKSEPESEEEYTEENQNMEEKMKYLSALNIHEKTAERQKQEKNEIRTRSKAEEKRERFKVVDNLTRIIDDVALNYSAKHGGDKGAPKKPERRKSGSSFPTEGEITVKSFARLPTTPPSIKQRARKTFPIPMYIPTHPKNAILKKDVSLLRREPNSNPNRLISAGQDMPANPIVVSDHSKVSTTSTSTKTTVAVTSVTTVTTSSVNLISQASTVAQSSPSVNLITPPAVNILQTSGGELTTTITSQALTMGHVILMPSVTGMNYCTPVFSTVAQPAPSLVPTPNVSQSTQSTKKAITTPNLKTSQNYIPPDDVEIIDFEPAVPVHVVMPNTTVSNRTLNPTISIPESISPPSVPITRPTITETVSTAIAAGPSTSTSTSARTPGLQKDDELSILHGLLPESMSRVVNQILLKPPPRLKPRPPGILNRNYDEGVPSSAGDVTSRINSIAYRMTDYFRGMLIETLEDFGKAAHPEAKITSLQLEMEALKHRHEQEMTEVRNAMANILQNVQKRVMEERTIIIDKTKAECEAEAIRRVEAAKLKQWCANCPKEAQFYCCWNTSYCDYPCQQKHWPQHASKCTQDVEKTSGTAPGPPNRPTAPLILRPALPPKQGMGRMPVQKPSKVYLRTNAPPKGIKGISGLTFVETTPGNYEFIGNNSISLSGNKLYTNNTSIANSKFKAIPASVISSSSTTSTVTSDSSKQLASSSSKP
ncbi:protein kinase C-binding protein 1 isoform X2 [Diabrotica virgifera virgifera]|uniref:Protein kinase C-binding protein 1 n=1 Tax=Diabrotica virgifera virgifera TaxID=50390 RepID=A0ABM5KXB3_DIAVI|nr:protein kinase C-binding protein 1 isoform X2 [Diabrotica virgifera virgifera]